MSKYEEIMTKNEAKIESMEKELYNLRAVKSEQQSLSRQFSIDVNRYEDENMHLRIQNKALKSKQSKMEKVVYGNVKGSGNITPTLSASKKDFS